MFYPRYAALREPKRVGAMPSHEDTEDGIITRLREHGFTIQPFAIDVAGFQRYLQQAAYQRFPSYYGGGGAENFLEKALEHYVAASLLQLRPDDTYIDIASAGSPASAIYREVYGCVAYRQDLAFPPGIHGETIGGDAANLPVPDGFASAMTLHCSFEHFEGDSDARFIREAGRVLRPGGRLCILPLYLYAHYAVLTNPVYSRGVGFEPDAVLYCDWRWPERHGRFYDPAHLLARVRSNLSGMSLTLFTVTNAHEAYPSSYLRFIAFMEQS
ncbi:MAG: class I SAM-dependent methyltransferase [Gammaproteobacteria bacterium]